MQRKTTKAFLISCVIGLYLLGTSFIWAEQLEKSVLATSEKQLVFTLQNRDASPSARQMAADQVLAKFVKSSGSELIAIIENSDELKTLQNHVINIVSSSQNSYLIELLEKRCLDSALSSYARRATLSCLWKTDPTRALNAARIIAVNSYELDAALRFESIGYLSKEPDSPENIEALRRLYSDKKESVTLRKAAFFFLESGKDRQILTELLLSTLTDIDEIKGFRLLALERLQVEKSPELNNTLIKLLFDSKEAVGIRQTALNALKSDQIALARQLPQLRSLYKRLRFSDFKESIRQTISELESTKKPHITKQK